MYYVQIILKMHRFKELEVWKLSVDMVIEIYEITKTFPKNEKFGLVNQIRKSAISIPSNIAEGAGKNTKNNFNRFIGIAAGSSNELETQLIISQKLEYISQRSYLQIEKKLHMIQNMLFKLQQSLRNT